jgi:hypothetical protein
VQHQATHERQVPSHPVRQLGGRGLRRGALALVREGWSWQVANCPHLIAAWGCFARVGVVSQCHGRVGRRPHCGEYPRPPVRGSEGWPHAMIRWRQVLHGRARQPGGTPCQRQRRNTPPFSRLPSSPLASASLCGRRRSAPAGAASPDAHGIRCGHLLPTAVLVPRHYTGRAEHSTEND